MLGAGRQGVGALREQRPGDVVARLDTSELQAARRQLEARKRELEAQHELARQAKKLLAEDDPAGKTRDQLKVLTWAKQHAEARIKTAKADLAELEGRMAPLKGEIDQLSRQFWVEKKAVKANKYDLSASRYRQAAPDETYHEAPRVTMERLLTLERVMREEVEALEELLGWGLVVRARIEDELCAEAETRFGMHSLVREVAAEFGDAVVLREHCSDDPAIRDRYGIERAIYIDGREVGWGYEAPKDGLRETIRKAMG